MVDPRNVYVAIVDDDESLRRSLSRLLRAAGLQPIAYPSAEAFLNDMDQPRFGCLVLDVRMGGMSGTDLQKHLVRSGSRTPIIFITAHDDPVERQAALAAGCAGFYRKSDGGDTIVNEIRKLTQATRAPPKKPGPSAKPP